MNILWHFQNLYGYVLHTFCRYHHYHFRQRTSNFLLYNFLKPSLHWVKLVKCLGQTAGKAFHVSLSKYAVSNSGKLIATALRLMEVESQDIGCIQLHSKIAYLQFSEDARSLQKGFSHHHLFSSFPCYSVALQFICLGLLNKSCTQTWCLWL